MLCNLKKKKKAYLPLFFKNFIYFRERTQVGEGQSERGRENPKQTLH